MNDKQERKECGCTKPEMTLDESGMGFTVKRLMCKKHAKEFKNKKIT